jgi:ribonuclease VapC
MDGQEMNAISVLDTSAILAVILDEDGAGEVLAISKPRAASSVIMSEVRSKLFDRGYSRELIDAGLKGLGIREIAFDAVHAVEAADLRPLTRKGGLSFADRACLATAKILDATAITADRIWKELPLPVRVELIR